MSNLKILKSEFPVSRSMQETIGINDVFRSEEVENENELQACRQKLRDITEGLQSHCKMRESKEGAEDKGGIHMDLQAEGCKGQRHMENTEG